MKLIIAGAAVLALLAGGCEAAARPAPAPPAAAPAFSSQRLSVTVQGNPRGPDVVLIPGLASSQAVWDRTAAALAPTHRLHRVQVGGFAGAPAGANAAGPVFEALVEEVDRYIRSQGLRRPAVIGHSMGGATGVALAARHPGSVGRLMVVDSLPFFSVLMNPAATVETAKPAATAMAQAMKAGTPEQFAAEQAAALARMINSPAAGAQRARESGRSDRAVAAQVVYDLMTTDLRPELGRITAPVTVLFPYDRATFGTGPETVEPVYARSYAGLRGAQLVRVDDSLHFIMDDQPERFEREVRAFLAAP